MAAGNPRHIVPFFLAIGALVAVILITGRYPRGV
jgi:hypothetical protein